MHMKANGYKEWENEEEGFPANTDSKKHAHQSSWESLYGSGVKSVPIRFLSKPTQLIRAPAASDP